MSEAGEVGDAWRSRAEKGTLLGIRALVWLATAFGRGPARIIVRLVALYYTLVSPGARRASASFLRRVGEPVTFWAQHRQILRFAQVGLDALFLLSGKVDAFEVTLTGNDNLDRLKRDRQSAILLGAHLGSFYAMRAQGGEESLPLYAVAYTKHARRINGVLEALDPTSTTRLLQMGEGVDFMMRIRDLVDDGALIAILGDRVHTEERSVEVDFLGGRARFPTGPFLLAATLKVPVYLTFGLYRDPNRYDLFCEPFAERVVLPRGDRQGALQGYVQAYAERLEHFCRLAPDNWFNFFEFWSPEPETMRASTPAPPADERVADVG